MRVALTGATGLIGSAVSRALAVAGHEIVTIGRAAGSGVRFDLAAGASLDPKALAGCDALLHAAGVTDEDTRDERLPAAKRHGARELLAAAAVAGVPRLAYFSSAHVYGPLEGVIDESRPPDPRNAYARSHREVEAEFEKMATQRGVTALIARPCAVFGTPPSLERFARWSLIPFDFPRQALQGTIVLKSAGLQRRNFVSAEGLGSLVGWWMSSPAEGTLVANAPGPHEMSVYEFAVLCARIAQDETGRPCRIERPAPEGAPAAPSGPPFEYRTRVGGHLPGTLLEDHVRALMRALSKKAHS
jgi:UDP-glucose 4-epimerase